MAIVTRKQIENYYEQEWSEFVSTKSVDLLVDLTCQSYQLNQPQTPGFIKQREAPKPQDLGQI